MNNEIRRLLRPYAGRLRRRTWLRRFGVIVCAGVAAGILLLGISFLVPIRAAPALAVLLAAAVCLLFGLVAALVPPRPERLAADIDRCGFQERVQTMLALQYDDSPFAHLQRADTFRVLGTADPKACIPILPPRRLFAMAGAGILLAGVLAILPSPQDDALREQAEIRQVMQEQARRVEADLELLQKDSSLSEAQKRELNEKLRELAKELREGKDYKEGIKQISQLQKELDDLQKKGAEDQLGDLRSALEQKASTKGLAEKMAEQTPEEASEELQKAVQEAMEKDGEGDGKQSEELAEALREAAEAMEDGNAKEAMEKLAEALEEGDQAAAAEALQELEEALDGADAGDANGNGSTMAQIGDNLKLAKSRMSQASQGQAFTGDPSQLTGNGQEGQGQEGQAGSGQGQSGQQGQGAGQGQGQGAGQGQGGQQGQGSGQGSGQGQGQGQGSGQGAGAGSGALVESEKIYDSRRLEDEGRQENLQGDINSDGPRQQAETDAGEGSLDGYVPYQQVVGDYADDAVNAAKREQLPPAVQDWVEGYFSALQNQ